MKAKFKIPGNVSEETRVFMKSVLLKLEQSGVIEPCYYGSLIMLMTSYESYIQASKMVIQDGALTMDTYGQWKPNPAITVMNKSWGQVATFMKETGLTLKSREHIKSLTPSVDNDNELNKFLTR